jgi:hypothetical protein
MGMNVQSSCNKKFQTAQEAVEERKIELTLDFSTKAILMTAPSIEGGKNYQPRIHGRCACCGK